MSKSTLLLFIRITSQSRKILREMNDLTTEEGKRALSLLCKLAKSINIFPRCYELKGIQCDPLKPLGGGGFAEVYKGEYGSQAICLKIVRLHQNQDKIQLLAVSAIIFYISDLWAHNVHRYYRHIPENSCCGPTSRTQTYCHSTAYTLKNDHKGFVSFPPG